MFAIRVRQESGDMFGGSRLGVDCTDAGHVLDQARLASVESDGLQEKLVEDCEVDLCVRSGAARYTHQTQLESSFLQRIEAPHVRHGSRSSRRKHLDEFADVVLRDENLLHEPSATLFAVELEKAKHVLDTVHRVLLPVKGSRVDIIGNYVISRRWVRPLRCRRRFSRRAR